VHRDKWLVVGFERTQGVNHTLVVLKKHPDAVYEIRVRTTEELQQRADGTPLRRIKTGDEVQVVVFTDSQTAIVPWAEKG
jgi:hypothetical protein